MHCSRELALDTDWKKVLDQVSNVPLLPDIRHHCRSVLDMIPTVLRFDDLSTMLLRSLYDYSSPTTLFLQLLVGQDPAKLALSMFKISVVRA